MTIACRPQSTGQQCRDCQHRDRPDRVIGQVMPIRTPAGPGQDGCAKQRTNPTWAQAARRLLEQRA